MKDSQKTYDIDVFMPYHKFLEYVPEAINSILCQVGINPLLHLVNDCSLEDDSFLKEKYKNNKNIRWYKTKDNIGPYAIANALFYYCESDYIAIRDSDDIACPDSFINMLRKLKIEQADIIGGRMTQFPESGFLPDKSKNHIEKQMYIRSKVDIKNNYVRIINGTMILTKSCFEDLNGFFGNFKCGADIEFINRAFLSNKKIIAINEVVGFRRYCENSLSNNSSNFGGSSKYRRNQIKEAKKRYSIWEKEGLTNPKKWGTLDDNKTKDLISIVDISEEVKKDRVYACIATIPRRIYSLEKTIESLIDQVDFIKIYLNNFCHVPDFLKNNKIEIIFGNNELKGSTKFYWADKVDGYLFTCDDDLIYPSNYVEEGKKAIDKYNCICGSHGAKINDGKIFNYYRDRKVYNAKREVKEDVFVDIIGTGTICFHTRDIKIFMEDMIYPNREDFSIMRLAYLRAYKMLIYAHPENWLIQCTGSNDKGLYGEAVLDCTMETKLANEFRNFNEIKNIALL